ncbi:MutS-related protein [Endozoicomonas atrinae]|uniref:MutS-related protein n=2 Tax=Endozoicomonas atrinae TaxID=1333660 RepID=UPI003AFFF51A
MQRSAATKTETTGHKKKLFIIIIGILIPSLNIQAELGIKNTYRISQQHFSKAYPDSDEKIGPTENEAELPDIILTPGEKRKIILKSLTQQTIEQDSSENKILTHYAVKDLDLLNGSTLSPDHSILKSLGTPITVSGEIMLANMLINPTTDINVLEKRQSTIQYLIDNPILMAKLENHLRRFSTNEDGIISLLDPSDTIYKGLFQSLDATTQFGMNPKTSNEKEASRRFIESLNLLGLGFMPTYLYYNSSNPLHLATGLTLYGLTLYLTQRSARREKNYYTYVMERSRRPGLSLFEARKLWMTLEDHPLFHDVFLSYPEFSKLDNSKELREILGLLKDTPDTPIRSIWQYYTSHMGCYHMALELMQKHKNSMLSILQAIGEVDAWLTIAKLVSQGQERENNPITFAKYIPDHHSPYLRLDRFWNPHLSPAVAVANSIEIGAQLPLNTIITGPNAAGKSTNMEGIAIAALMAQTFGIAPAQHIEITPFSLIHTHMDISSEVAAGLSTFKAESVRAIELMDHIENMKEYQFSLTLMDEIFSSTNPIEGEAGTYGYLKIISNNRNSINICTTHYPRPTLLADEYPGIFQNMHVHAEITSDGRLVYDYLLKPGYSEQHIAIKILEDEGIQSEFLDIATEIIKHPERYPLQDRRH